MKTVGGTITQLDDNATDIFVAVQRQGAVSKEIAAAPTLLPNGHARFRQAVVHVSDAATKAGELATAVLSAGIGFAERSDRRRAEVEHFFAQVRVASIRGLCRVTPFGMHRIVMSLPNF